MIFYSVVGFLTSRLFQQYLWCYHPSFDVSPRSFYFLTFSLLSLFRNYKEKRKEKKQRKKILEAHQSFNNDTTGIIGKISMRQIQQHQRSSQTVNERVTWAIQRCQGSLAFGLLMWSTLGYTRSWCCWICLIEIFVTALIVSLLKLWCDSRILFFFFFLSLLSHY